MNKIIYKYLILLALLFLTVGCEDDTMIPFSGEVVSITKAGYSVFHGHGVGESGAWDLAEIRMDLPERFKRKEVKVILDSDEGELLKEGDIISFKLWSSVVKELTKKEGKSVTLKMMPSGLMIDLKREEPKNLVVEEEGNAEAPKEAIP